MTTLIGLDLSGLPVTVAGAGAVGARRVRALVDAGAVVTCVALDAVDEIEQMARAGTVTFAARPVRAEDLDGAWLAVAATADEAVNAQVVEWARERRVFCVNASDASRGGARFAAAASAAGLVVGVLSDGAPDPVRVVRVRDALGASLDEGAVDLRRSRAGEGMVQLVGAGPGDPDLHTVALRRALRSADVVVADRLGTAAALRLVPDEVEVVDVGKSPGRHAKSQTEINQLLVDKARAGLHVVRLKGGDPFVFGRGGEEMTACLDAGVRVEVVPGVTSALAVPARAGIPATQRGVSRSVLVTSGHDGAAPEAIAAMKAGATVSILMGVERLPDIAAAAIAAGVAPDTAVAIVEAGTTEDERVTRGTLATIRVIAAETGVKSPAVIVVGAVAESGLIGSDAARTPREEATGDDT